MQTYVEKGRIKLKKVKGTENVADLGTKALSEDVMLRCLSQCSIYPMKGRHPLALKAALGEKATS